MGWATGLGKWLEDKGKERAKRLNGDWLGADFDLLYKDNLAQQCTPPEIEQIREKYIEWTELGLELRANALNPSDSVKIQRVIKLEMFFNNLAQIVKSGQLQGELTGLDDVPKSLDAYFRGVEREKTGQGKSVVLQEEGPLR